NPEALNLEADEKNVNDVHTAFYALHADVRNLMATVEKVAVDTLKSAMDDLASDRDSAAFLAQYATELALTVDSVAIGNKAKVAEAETEYGGLTSFAKAKVDAAKPGLTALFNSLLDKIADYEVADFKTEYAAEIALDVNTVILANFATHAGKVTAALDDYNALDSRAQAKLATEIGKLTALSGKVEFLTAQDNLLKDLDGKIGTVYVAAAYFTDTETYGNDTWDYLYNDLYLVARAAILALTSLEAVSGYINNNYPLVLADMDNVQTKADILKVYVDAADIAINAIAASEPFRWVNNYSRNDGGADRWADLQAVFSNAKTLVRQQDSEAEINTVVAGVRALADAVPRKPAYTYSGTTSQALADSQLYISNVGLFNIGSNADGNPNALANWFGSAARKADGVEFLLVRVWAYKFDAETLTYSTERVLIREARLYWNFTDNVTSLQARTVNSDGTLGTQRRIYLHGSYNREADFFMAAIFGYAEDNRTGYANDIVAPGDNYQMVISCILVVNADSAYGNSVESVRKGPASPSGAMVENYMAYAPHPLVVAATTTFTNTVNSIESNFAYTDLKLSAMATAFDTYDKFNGAQKALADTSFKKLQGLETQFLTLESNAVTALMNTISDISGEMSEIVPGAPPEKLAAYLAKVLAAQKVLNDVILSTTKAKPAYNADLKADGNAQTVLNNANQALLDAGYTQEELNVIAFLDAVAAIGDVIDCDIPGQSDKIADAKAAYDRLTTSKTDANVMAAKNALDAKDAEYTKDLGRIKFPTDQRPNSTGYNGDVTGNDRNALLYTGTTGSFEITRNKGGSYDFSSYMMNTNVAGVQIAVYANDVMQADIDAGTAPVLGYFWVVNGDKYGLPQVGTPTATTWAYMVPSLDWNDVNALPDTLRAATDANFRWQFTGVRTVAGTLNDLYGDPVGSIFFQNMLRTLDPSWTTGNRSFKFSARIVADPVAFEAGTHKSGGWSSLTLARSVARGTAAANTSWTKGSLQISTQPSKAVYAPGETFDPAGMVVRMVYGTGTANRVDLSITGLNAYTVDTTTPLVAGTTFVKVSFRGFSVNVPVTVGTAAGIEIDEGTVRKTYAIGETFNPAGMIVRSLFDTGGVEPVKAVIPYGGANGYSIEYQSGNAFSAGDTKVTVVYGTDREDVTITLVTLTDIEIVTEPNKVDYINGDTFSLAGLTVRANYGDGSSQMVTTWEPDFADNTALDGSFYDKTVTVSYLGKTDTFDITVKTLLSIEVRGTFNKEYAEGERFDPTGLTVEATFSRGDLADEVVELTSGYTFSPTLTTALTKTHETSGITVTYRGITTNIGIKVTANVRLGPAPILPVAIGETRTISVGITLPEGVELTWASSNTSIATVDQDGIVTGKANGDATITAVDVENGYAGSITVRVSAAVVITTADQFASLILSGQNQYGIFYLGNDIDFGFTSASTQYLLTYRPVDAEGVWNSNQNDPTYFNGIFDGRGYALKNLNMRVAGDGSGWDASIFYTVGAAGIVRNLGVINFTSAGGGRTSVIAGHNFGIVENCYFENIQASSGAGGDGQCLSSIIGFNYNIIRNCVVASAYSAVASGNARFAAIVNRQRTITGGTRGVVDNCFVNLTNLAATYGTPAVRGPWNNYVGDAGGFVNSVRFDTAETRPTGVIAFEAVNFSTLDSAIWNLDTAAFATKTSAVLVRTNATTFNPATSGTLTYISYIPGTPVLKPQPVTTPSISLNKKATSIEEGEAETLTAWTWLLGGETVAWNTSDATVATVAGGVVSAVTPGTATITASFAVGGVTYSYTCVVTVTAAPEDEDDD
ncbi:MAG: bacterial Ig-like domain-containing protein, partial [Firmicutes bacterium]|nr:bacterial Ig-like domain-containing protein [Bacillota bacterium]